jgi:ATP-dependent DNA helicase RecQ
MLELTDHDAFEALARLLANEDSPPWRSSAPAFDRLRAALSDSNSVATSADLAVLLRQALRYEYARRGHQVSPLVHVRHIALAKFSRWEQFGLAATREPGGWRVSSHAWRPVWLQCPALLGVEDEASGEAVRRKFGGLDCEGDPFLKAVARTAYRSSGQRAAVRAALSTPSGATLVVALPTGEGKSLIFQLAHTIGFVGEETRAQPGVVLVIVPTVALGVNHEEEAVGVCGISRPLAYQGGADTANSMIVERIAEGSQGLCFTSPEAACSSLRPSLRKASEAGHLRAIVIDEAHLVDQWGTGFRTEFQELSGLRRELVRLAPIDKQPRTILLSATLTESSRETLRALFGDEGSFESSSAVRLRPEPDYWVAVSAEHERVDRVLEALHHVPRPAVLYVTQIEHAKVWFNRLLQAGFGRVRMLHGETQREDREQIVSLWRQGLLDVVIGTSAFGLGIDFAHARSVIHACVPETLDRFYQEVGRGGRDGRAALSLIVPAPSDYATAKRINHQKVISVKRGLERWTAMFGAKHPLADNRIAVRMDISPGTSADDIDMTGLQSSDWNLRTLSLMARSGLVRLHGSPQPALPSPGDWLTLDLLDDGHLERSTWDIRVEPVRLASQNAGNRNFHLMQQFLRDEFCPAEIFEHLYGSDSVERVCSRCSICRDDPDRRRPPSSFGEPIAPWRLTLPPLLKRLLDANQRLLVSYRTETAGRAVSRRLGDTLQRLQRIGLGKVIVLGTPPFDMDRVLKCGEGTPLFVSRLPSLVHSRLPGGPELIIVGPGQTLGYTSLAPNHKNPRIFIVPENQSTSDGRRLCDVFAGRILALDEFIERVAL